MSGRVMSAPRWRLELQDYVGVLVPSPDGRLLAAGSLAGDTVLVSADTGEVIAQLVDHNFGTMSAAWSPDGNVLAVGGQDGVVHLYTSSGALVGSAQLGGWVASLDWSPRGDVLAAGSGKQVSLIDRDGQLRHRWAEVSSTVTAVAWATNAKRVGATSYGGVSWFDPESDATIAKSHFSWKGSLLSLAMSPDGKWACAGAQDASIHLWKLWSGDDLSMSGYPAKVEHLAFRRDGRWMASGCLEELTIWDFSGSGPRGKAPAVGTAHSRHISALAWQPFGDLIATGAADGLVAVWASPKRKGQTIEPIEVIGPESSNGDLPDYAGVGALHWRVDGTGVMVSRSDGTVESIDVRAR